MNQVPLHILFFVLLLFVLLSAFFSGSETGMMFLNRYRLRHLARKRHRAALRSSKLLERIDRLLGVILIGNTFANVLASALATIIAVRLFGTYGVLIATIIMTLVILVFAEITPKTIAASYPEKFAFIASLPLQILLKILYPIVWSANTFVNSLLRIFHLSPKSGTAEPLSYDELKTVVYESGSQIMRRHQDMLLRILDLRTITVNDIMVPRSEVFGIDINDAWEEVLAQLQATKHAHILLYRDTIDNVQGILHLHKVVALLLNNSLTKKSLLQSATEIYFIPEATSLTTQLLNFQQRQLSLAIVVDEYGDIQGLVTLEDILEEIVGEFASEAESATEEIIKIDSNNYYVDGGINIRDLNREMDWHLPIDGPKTLNGLIVEYLETIPQPKTSVMIAGYPLEIVALEGNAVKTVKIGKRRVQ